MYEQYDPHKSPPRSEATDATADSKKRKASPDDEEHSPEQPDPTRFISSPESFLEALQDLHADEESIMFTNVDGDLTFILQSTSESTDEIMSFDISLMYDDSIDCHGKLKTLLDHEYNAVYNDDENWTLYVFALSQEPSSTELHDMMRLVNKTYNMRICECFEHLVKSPKRSVCYLCTMRKRATQEPQKSCVICNDAIQTPMGSVTMKSCCGQVMHRRCLELWRRDDARKICPICRKNTSS